MRGKLDPVPIQPWTDDVNIWRDPDTQEVGASVPRTVIWHSPDGFNFGYAGSGPADLALNILNAFVPPKKLPRLEDDDFEYESMPVECFKGKCSKFAARWHQKFKEDFLVSMRSPGGVITAQRIQAWITEKRALRG